MKKVIREGVFETNSSSTHTVSFVRKETEERDKESSCELRSAFAKMMFLIGLCENASRIPVYFEEDMDEALAEMYPEGEIPLMSDKDVCEKFLLAVKEEYMKEENIDEGELEKRIAESDFSYEGKCHCSNFFDDDVLIECTCPFDGYSGMVSSLELYNLYTDEDYKKRAKEFLCPEYKFILKEYWCGLELLEKGEIY